MLYQKLETDIVTISKSAKGRVLFYNANGDCVLGASEQEDIQLHFLESYIYIFQKSSGSTLYDATNPTSQIAINGSLYKFTVWGLTDIDGRPFTALDNATASLEDYVAKVRDAYEYLAGNVFVGCCGTSTNSVLWYADEASFPATGLTETLYVDMATPALFLWDGSGYVAFGGGSGGAYIPLAGTVSGSPVTGDIEVTGGVAMFVENSGIARVLWDDGNVGLEASALDGSLLTGFTVIAGAMLVASDEPAFAGIVYSTDYSANFNSLSLSSNS